MAERSTTFDTRSRPAARWFASVQIAVSVALAVAYCLRGIDHTRILSAATRAPHIVEAKRALARELDAFEALAAWLPDRGLIGYVCPGNDPTRDTSGADIERELLRLGAAQYALAPRKLTLGVDHRFFVAWFGSREQLPRFPAGTRIVLRHDDGGGGAVYENLDRPEPR